MRVRINQGNVRRLLTSPDGPVMRKVTDLCMDVTNTAKTRAPVDEGQLRASLDYAVEVQGSQVRGRVGSGLPQAAYINWGTGIYGPKGAPITPKHGKFLVFEPSRSMGPLRRGGKHAAKGRRGALVFAKQVRGTPKNPFLLESLQTVVPWPVTSHM